MRFLPKPSILDTVYLGAGPSDPRANDQLPKSSLYKSIVCKHLNSSAYTRIDHRVGPGPMADNYRGLVCMDCGAVLSEESTN